MNKKNITRIALGLAISSVSVVAEETAEPSVYDKIWNTVEFVDNDDATVIQSFALTGRLQGDAYSFRDDDSNSNDDTTWRRFRFGFKAKVFDDFTLHSEMDLDMNEADSDSWDKF